MLQQHLLKTNQTDSSDSHEASRLEFLNDRKRNVVQRNIPFIIAVDNTIKFHGNMNKQHNMPIHSLRSIF